VLLVKVSQFLLNVNFIEQLTRGSVRFML
jgi:hypothetical protein